MYMRAAAMRVCETIFTLSQPHAWWRYINHLNRTANERPGAIMSHITQALPPAVRIAGMVASPHEIHTFGNP